MNFESLISAPTRVPPRCAALLVIAVFSVGCPRNESVNETADSGKSAFVDVVWLEEGIAHEGVVIDLGYRPRTSGEALIEPVARITRSGSPVSSAMVFCGISPSDGAVGHEVATVYEQAESADDAIYAQGKLTPYSEGTTRIHFRIVFSGDAPTWTHEMILPQN